MYIRERRRRLLFLSSATRECSPFMPAGAIYYLINQQFNWINILHACPFNYYARRFSFADASDAHGRQRALSGCSCGFCVIFCSHTQLCDFLQPLHIIAANVRLLFPCESLNSLKAPGPGMSRPAISCSQPLALIGLKCILCLKFFTCKNSSARRLNSKHKRKVLSLSIRGFVFVGISARAAALDSERVKWFSPRGGFYSLATLINTSWRLKPHFLYSDSLALALCQHKLSDFKIITNEQ